jgi:hypothetical protein
MVGGRVVRTVRRRVAPAARRDLAAEIDADALAVEHVWTRKLIAEPAPDSDDAEPAPTVVILIDRGLRAEIAAWLDPGRVDADRWTVRTDWLLFPATPEAVLMVVAEDADYDGEENGAFHFNLRLNADLFRRQLQTLAKSGRLGLTTAPLQVGADWTVLSPCRFLPVPTTPLHEFLREIPAPPVV